MAKTKTEKSWRDALPESQKAIGDGLEQRKVEWMAFFEPAQGGLEEVILWVVERAATPVVYLMSVLTLLRYVPEVRFMVALMALVPVLAFGMICRLQWSVAGAWIQLTMIVVGVALVLNLPSILALFGV